ncbi:MAG: DUF2628 domain-containing protein [Pelagibacterales bacterium]|nr:DUF2628 domain-containing protein [Pelagibacterales bacterium]
MKLYNALIKKNKEGKIEDIILLKDGFSYPAFFLNSIWFLYNKMWKEFGVLLGVSFSFMLLKALSIFSLSDVLLLELIFTFIIALNFNYWLVEHLKKQGYEFIGLVFGSDMTNAKMRFVKNLENEQNSEEIEFDISITDPKLYRQMLKKQKKEHYFVT